MDTYKVLGRTKRVISMSNFIVKFGFHVKTRKSMWKYSDFHLKIQFAGFYSEPPTPSSAVINTSLFNSVCMFTMSALFIISILFLHTAIHSFSLQIHQKYHRNTVFSWLMHLLLMWTGEVMLRRPWTFRALQGHNNEGHEGRWDSTHSAAGQWQGRWPFWGGVKGGAGGDAIILRLTIITGPINIHWSSCSWPQLEGTADGSSRATQKEWINFQ